ncbi:hypothetical protein D3C80_2094440 [compost metagenome]
MLRNVVVVIRCCSASILSVLHSNAITLLSRLSDIGSDPSNELAWLDSEGEGSNSVINKRLITLRSTKFSSFALPMASSSIVRIASY